MNADGSRWFGTKMEPAALGPRRSAGRTHALRCAHACGAIPNLYKFGSPSACSLAGARAQKSPGLQQRLQMPTTTSQRRRRRPGKIDDKNTALTGQVADVQFPPVRLDAPPADGEPQAQ